MRNRGRRGAVALVIGLGLLAGTPAYPQGDDVRPRDAILLAIDASDNVQAMRATIGGMLARLSGRDEEPVEPGSFGRFVMADTVPERTVRIYLGYEAGAQQDVLALIEEIPSVIVTQSEFAAPITRAQMLARLRARALNDNIERVWDVRQNTRTDGLIAAKFRPILEP